MRLPSPRVVNSALLGASAMFVGTAKFVHVILAVAAHSEPQHHFLIGWIALWTMLFGAGAWLIVHGCRDDLAAARGGAPGRAATPRLQHGKAFDSRPAGP